MIKNKILLNVVTLLLLFTLKGNAQQTKLAKYKGDKYIFEYPVDWQITNENGILNFFPSNEIGALTFSHKGGIDLSQEVIKEVILEIHGIKDKSTAISVTQKGGIAEFYLEHIDKNSQWITKAIRKNKDFYLITINCKLENWDTNKIHFLSIMNSFKIL